MELVEEIPVKSKPYSFPSLSDLIKIHVIGRREIYSLLNLKRAYESLKYPCCPTLPTTDIKSKVASVFLNDVIFSGLTFGRTRNKQEYILPMWEIRPKALITRLIDPRKPLDSRKRVYKLIRCAKILKYMCLMHSHKLIRC